MSKTRIVHRIPSRGPALFEVTNRMPSRKEMQEYVGGEIEYVYVLFNKERTMMIVNELGSGVFGHPQLPVNEKATEIYHAASLARGLPKPDALVYGNVLVLEGFDIE